jgi:hypothetical protein
MRPLFIFLLIAVPINSLQGQVGFNNAYVTMRQMKLMNIPGALTKAKMSTIQNIETMIYIQKLMRNSPNISDISQIGNQILDAPSVGYVKTTLQQSGYEIGTAKIVKNQSTYKLKARDIDDEFAVRGLDEGTLKKNGLNWDTELYINFDIYFDLIPIK